MTNAEPLEQSGDAIDPGMRRAGAAAAARRRELDISQRSLAADGIINAGALIAFEKGRSWPRERTRARLEEVLRWQPGTIARLRRGENIRPTDPVPPPDPSSSGDESSLIAQAVVTAAGTLRSTVAGLPAPDHPAFVPGVASVLADLRRLEAIAVRAARLGRVTPPLIKALGTVRSLYDEVMTRAAAGPDATLGQRVYAARRGATLTVEEMAQAAGVDESAVRRVEAGEPIDPQAATALSAFVSDLA